MPVLLVAFDGVFALNYFNLVGSFCFTHICMLNGLLLSAVVVTN